MSLSPILTIDLPAIQENYRLITRQLGPACRAAAMVKADAYGLSAAMVAPALERAGCTLFFVASLQEALSLRHHTQQPIAVLHGCGPDEKAAFTQSSFIPVLNTLEQVALWDADDGPFFLHIDTGMNRLGLSIEDVPAFLQTGKKPDVVMSHFACADEPNHPNTEAQYESFRSIIDLFHAADQQPLFSLANSAGIFCDTRYHYDLVRPGMGLYGLNPTPAQPNPMQPIVSLKTPIIQIRHAYQGETVGYGADYTLPHDSVLATLPLGYADGFHRAGRHARFYWTAPDGAVYPCPIVGRVSMDLIVVDIGHITMNKPEISDYLEIIGPSQSVDDLAKSWHTIGYEILTSFGKRYQKIYIPSE